MKMMMMKIMDGEMKVALYDDDDENDVVVDDDMH
jgi:hypothetical protein